MTKIKRTPEWSPEMAQWNLLPKITLTVSLKWPILMVAKIASPVRTVLRIFSVTVTNRQLDILCISESLRISTSGYALCKMFQILTCKAAGRYRLKADLLTVFNLYHN